jgi:cAMP-dependent protein kinase regulator
MGPGEIFGEMSLLSGAPRLASVVATEDSELLELGRAHLAAIETREPDATAVVQRIFRERLLVNFLRASPIFCGLSDERRRALMEVVHVETYEDGHVVIPQGSDGKVFYVLLRGECDVSHTAASGEEQTHPRMHEGDVFGEIALLQGGPTTATVRAVGRCVVLALQREWFDELLLRDPSARARIYALAAERLDRTSAAVARLETDHGLV